jgi:hypothetical protein
VKPPRGNSDPSILSTGFRGLFPVRGQRAAVGIVIGITALVVLEAVTQAGCEATTTAEMLPSAAEVAAR